MNDVYLLFQSDPAKNQTFQEASSIQMPSTFYFTTKLSKINTFEFSFKGCNSNWERFVLKGSRQKKQHAVRPNRYQLLSSWESEILLLFRLLSTAAESQMKRKAK